MKGKDKKIMTLIAVTQSNYIPWKGYFDIIDACDHVVLLDNVQYTRRDWRNRNKIKTPQGLKWLTIPVNVSGKYANLRISEVEVSDPLWAEKHWSMIHQNYHKSPKFQEIEGWLKKLYEKASSLKFLSEINRLFLEEICKYLDIQTTFSWSTDSYSIEELDSFSSTERLLKLAQKYNATDYLTGPLATNYMDVKMFEDREISVLWANYDNYSEYPQIHGDFCHGVTILDMFFMLGKDTKRYMKGRTIINS